MSGENPEKKDNFDELPDDGICNRCYGVSYYTAEKQAKREKALCLGYSWTQKKAVPKEQQPEINTRNVPKSFNKIVVFGCSASTRRMERLGMPPILTSTLGIEFIEPRRVIPKVKNSEESSSSSSSSSIRRPGEAETRLPQFNSSNVSNIESNVTQFAKTTWKHTKNGLSVVYNKVTEKGFTAKFFDSMGRIIKQIPKRIDRTYQYIERKINQMRR